MTTRARSSAPGGPGDPARWAEADKSAIGTAIAEESRVWFSTARGVLTEVFHPAPDRACTRALGFTTTGAEGFCSDERLDARHELRPSARPGALASLVSTCARGRYRLEKEILCDPHADVVLQRVRFVATSGDPGGYRLFCSLDPHLGEDGSGMVAEVGEHKGASMLFASRADGSALALASSAPWLAASAGFAGTSDGRLDLRAHGQLVNAYARAADGNVTLTGEIDHRAVGGAFTLALGFGRTTAEAAHAASSSLVRGYDAARLRFVEEWEAWHAKLRECRPESRTPRLWVQSTTVLKTLEAKLAGGGRVAALSTPWGPARGPGIDGTYHLVWTRDLVECLGALLAAGAHGEVKGALHYLRSTQEADGHWPQNMRLSGEAFWDDDELDEVALPVVFLHLVEREGLLTDLELKECWPMIRRAAGFLARRGPSTLRDRWEDVEGVTPFTIATEIVALLVAADAADRAFDPGTAGYLRELADEWYDAIDPLLFRRGGALAAHVGVEGYYVRARKPGEPFVRDLDVRRLPKTELSPDALALVRFGLRAPDDPRIVDTVRVVDAVLRTELAAGPCWRRYPGDEYGEHQDGSPFDGHGIGRPWPLLTGERAHYELACGRVDRATDLLHTMEAFANASGMLPEQVWDQDDVPARGLSRGAPSGSAAPLGWAHGEYVKLCRSLVDGGAFDMPEHARRRYAGGGTASRIQTHRRDDPARRVTAGKTLRIVRERPFTLEWTADAWRSSTVTHARGVGIGLFYADVLPTGASEVRLRVRPDAPFPADDELVMAVEAAS